MRLYPIPRPLLAQRRAIYDSRRHELRPNDTRTSFTALLLRPYVEAGITNTVGAVL